MNPPNSLPSPRALQPLPYLLAMRDFLKTEEPELWHWFSSNQVRAEHAEAVRLDLLKSTYRLEPGTHPQLYDAAAEVLTKLALQAPVTLYQAQSSAGLNAGLAFLPGEVHVILVGPVLNTLSPGELRAMLGHELAHFLLLNEGGGEFLVVSEVLRALSNDAAAHPCHLESSRLFSLYTEIFADRGAFGVTGDALVCVATLVKLETGLTEVSAADYLRQAEEIFRLGSVRANQLTHPEPYIRARALQLFADRGEESTGEIEHLIRGPLALDRLDLLAQQRVAALTRRLLDSLLAPGWFRTEAVLAHANLFFHDYTPGAAAADEAALVKEIGEADPALQDYFSAVVLDFVAVASDLEEAPLAAALVLSRRLGLEQRFAALAGRELGLTKKRLAQVGQDAERILAEAGEAANTP